MTTYKIISFFKDAPDLCGEVCRNTWSPTSNLYSYQEACDLIEKMKNDQVYNGVGFRLEAAE